MKLKEAMTWDCVIYICGPISADTQFDEYNNLYAGSSVARKLSRKGIPTISPHAYSQNVTYGLGWKQCLGLDISLLKKCNALFAMPGWKGSRGCRLEVGYAQSKGIPVFYKEEELVCFVQSNFSCQDLEEKVEGIAACLQEIQ
jgi:hypothetical protein